jgi:hypothetical protein
LIKPYVVYCADIGSVDKGNFGWARLFCEDEKVYTTGNDLHELVKAIAEDLNKDLPVALGFECPLFVPITEDPSGLTRSRPGEGNRPWSAGAGASALATGLTEVVWTLERLRSSVDVEIPVFFRWVPFKQARRGLFLWEAFVTAEAKGNTHQDDAEIAVRRFDQCMPNPEAANAIKCNNVYSLVGAALIRAGWSSDSKLTCTQCLVIRA